MLQFSTLVLRKKASTNFIWSIASVCTCQSFCFRPFFHPFGDWPIVVLLQMTLLSLHSLKQCFSPVPKSHLKSVCFSPEKKSTAASAAVGALIIPAARKNWRRRGEDKALSETPSFTLWFYEPPSISQNMPEKMRRNMNPNDEVRRSSPLFCQSLMKDGKAGMDGARCMHECMNTKMKMKQPAKAGSNTNPSSIGSVKQKRSRVNTDLRDAILAQLCQESDRVFSWGVAQTLGKKSSQGAWEGKKERLID